MTSISRTKCPACQKFVNTAPFCSECGAALPQSILTTDYKNEPSLSNLRPTPPGQGVLIASWICLGAGLLIMSYSLLFAFFYGPLFLTGFILAIVAIAKGRTFGGVTALLASLIVPVIIWVGLAAMRTAQFAEDASKNIQAETDRQQQQKARIIPMLKFEEVSATTSFGYITLTGTLRNTGTIPADFIKIGVEWLDENGTMLDSNFTYVNAGEPLERMLRRLLR